MAEDKSQAIQKKSVKVQVRPEASQKLSNNIENVNREFQEKSTLQQAKDRGLPYVNIGKTPLNPDFLKLIDLEAAKKARLIPFFKVGKQIRVAVENPDLPETKDLIQQLTEKGFEVSINMASTSGLNEAFLLYEKSEKFKKPEIVKTMEQQSVETYEKEIATLSGLTAKLEQVTAEEGLNLINIGAMKTSASDIHYELEESKVRVRFRIDGVLHKVFEISSGTFEKIANQIKYEAKMKLNLTSVPQDGRYTFTLNDQKIAVRVSSIPTPYGESLVCRLLPTGDKILTFEELGFQTETLAKLQGVCDISNGMILATGPTGSGKSTTLYALLSKMRSPENKIITLEDPVEYNIEGVTQSQIDEKHGYDFASGLKTVLRQDPDIVMIGEIRDLETAQTAAQAALTGHIVLSTLHTNSAIETVPRLVNMGLAPFMIAPALNTVIAQRLVRRVCPNCSTMRNISQSEREEFERTLSDLAKTKPEVLKNIPKQIPQANSCEACSQTGYKGRLVIAEVIIIGTEMKDLILNNASTSALHEQARKEGMITIKEDGFLKAAQGLTTLEEVFRVTSVLD